LVAGAFSAALLISGRASAQGTTSEVAAAESVFQEAVRLIDAGRVAEACPKFAESHRLDPQGGVAFELGNCYEKIGKLASAWGAFNEAAARWRLRGDKRAGDAQKRAEALESKLAKLVIVVPAGSRVAGLSIKRNGTTIGEGQWDTPVPVDPGEVTIEATAPGKEPLRRTMKIERPGVTNFEVGVLADAKGSGGIARPPPPVEDAPFWGGQRIAAASAAGLGLVGLVVGGALGGAAAGKKSEMDKQCIAGAPPRCNDAGIAAYGEVTTLGTASTAALIAGGVLAGAGVVLWVTAPKSASGSAAPKTSGRPSMQVSVGVTSVSLRAVW